MSLLSMALSLFVLNYPITSDCGTDSPFTILSQSFEPSNPFPGDDVYWTINYMIPSNINISFIRSVETTLIDGEYSTEPQEYNLCEDNIVCPVEDGEHVYTSWYLWPNSLSESSSSTTMRWLDNSNNELLCARVDIT
jgi:hypothetical protein